MKVTTDACLFGAWAANCILESSLERKGSTTTPHILDIGSGTGLLALMLAQQTTAHTDTIEIDSAAIEQATENIAASPWKNSIRVLEGDARRYPYTRKYDVIISNPPFYEDEWKSDEQSRNIAHHSELLNIRDVLTIISHQLAPDGIFFLLLPYKRMQEIQEWLPHYPLQINQWVTVKPSVQHPPFRIFLAGSSKEKGTPPVRRELSIRNEHQQYTPEFIALLKDYYLYL